MRSFAVALGCVALLLACALPGWAQDAQNATDFEMGEVVVVGKPIIEGNVVDRYGSTTTVVGKEQIENLGAMDLTAALRKSPGVTIARYNMVGSFGGAEGGAVFVRGLGSSRPGSEIKTFIDGVPMYMGPWNHPLLDLMSIDLASSIEVIKGPQPQTVGNAFSAVNIVPKQQTGDDFSTTVQAAGGSFGTYMESVEHGGRLDDFDYYVGEGFRHSDGHRDNSDGSLFSGYANLGLQLNDNWAARMFALVVDNYADDAGPDTATGVSEGRYETGARLAAFTFANDYGAAHGEIKFFANAGEGVWSEQVGSVDVNDNEFWFYGIHAKEVFEAWEGGQIEVGFEQEWWDGIVSYDYDDGSEATLTIPGFSLSMPYIAISHMLGEAEGWHLTPSAGARGYLHNQFDSEFAPFAGLVAGYGPTEVFGSASRGIVYPGLDAVILWPASDWEDLEAEETTHLEAGLRHRFGNMAAIDLTYFHDDGKNRYTFTMPPNPPVWVNTEEFEISGLETTLTVTPLPTLSLFAGLTVQEVSPDDMPYAPETSVSAGFNWRFLENFTLSADCEYVSDMYALRQNRKTDLENTLEVDEHFLVNTRLGYDFLLESMGAKGEVYILVQNITDEEYEYRPDYPMPGVNGMLGMKLTF